MQRRSRLGASALQGRTARAWERIRLPGKPRRPGLEPVAKPGAHDSLPFRVRYRPRAVAAYPYQRNRLHITHDSRLTTHVPRLMTHDSRLTTRHSRLTNTPCSA